MRSLLLAVLMAIAGQLGAPSPQLALRPLQPQQSDSISQGTIQGIVKRADLPDGIADVQITLTGTSHAPGVPGLQLSRTTDAQGAFSFVGISAGRYTIRAQRAGYFAVTGPGEVPPSLGTQYVAIVSADTPDVRLTIPLVPGGTITGRVRDAEGRPAVNVSLSVLRVAFQDGRRVLVSASAASTPTGPVHQTDDRGEFRLFWFPPGEYFVRTDLPERTAARGEAATTYPRATFYPGVSDLARAIPIAVREGEEVTGIDFFVEDAPGFNVSGKITVSMPGGRILANGQVDRRIVTFYVVPQDADFTDRIPLATNNSRQVSPDQTIFDFQLNGIAPGRYYLYPLFIGGGSSTTFTYYSTRITVEIIDRDVTGVTGEIHRHPDLTLLTTLKSDAPVNAARYTARLQLRPQEALGALVTSSSILNQQPAADGSYVFPNLFPTRYKILVPAMPADYYVADIRQGAASLYDDATVTVTSEQSDPVLITFGADGGQIRGTVRKRGELAKAGRVVLVPAPSRRMNTLLYKRTIVQPDTGQFYLGGVAPGEYKIFAWESLPAGADENAEFLSQYENRGRSVSVNAGSLLSDIQIDLISPEVR